MTTVDTEKPAPAGEKRPPSLYRSVSSAVYRLVQGLLGDNPTAQAHARALLSRARRAAGAEPGQDPLIWSLIMEEILPELPDAEIGRGDDPSRGEWAAFTAITMFALHQQSKRSPMHAPGRSLGHAVGELARQSESGSTKSRFDALLVAVTPRAIQYQLRSIIGLLNAYEISLDYGRLAEDLKKLRFPDGRTRVAVMWGRDYVQALHPRSSRDASEPTASSPASD